jgi:protein-glutamine gamma-glutamyltransferase
MTATEPRGARTGWPARPAKPSPAAPEPVPPLGARIGVLTAGACGVLALFSTGLIAYPYAAVFAVLCALLVPAAACAPIIWPSAGGTTVRRMLSFALLAITLTLFLTNLVRMQPSDIVDLAVTFGGFLGRLLISVLLAQLFVTDKMRDLRVALAIAAGMFVLALGNDPGWLAVVALLVGWPAAVTTLAFDHAVRDRSKADSVAVSLPAALSGRSAGFASLAPGVGWVRVGWFSAVSGLVAVLLVLLLPHPSGIRPDQVGGAAGGGAPVSKSAAASRSAGTYTSGSLDMRTRGALPDTEVADVPIDSPSLWRGAVLDYYDGVSWRAPSDNTYGRSLAGGPHFELPSTDPRSGTGVERRDVVHRRSGFTGVLLAPGRPTSVDVDGQVLRLSGGYFITTTPGQDYPKDYTVSSLGTDLPRSELTGTPVAMAPGEAVPGHALELPGTVSERTRLLAARITRWATNRDAATRAVEDYLRTHETYRLDSPVPPPGADAVDNFLFVANTGFCEQFAAAEVVLLRAVGVPARLATGFAGGELSGDHRTLRGTDAHAWVEVWYPGIGWAASDPTAGSVRAAASVRERVSSWLHSAIGRLVLAGCVLLVAALVALLVWWLRRRARRAGDGWGPRRAVRRPLPPVLAAFDRLQRALVDIGAPRAPAESVSELAQRPALRAAADALAVVERTSYGARAPVGAEADDAVRTLDDLSGRLRADFAASEG